MKTSPRNRTMAPAIVALLTLGIAVFAATPRPCEAFQLIGAMSPDGTYCAGAFLSCGDADIKARWFTYEVPFWVNSSSAADASDPGFAQSEIDAAAQASYQSWQDVPNCIIRFRYMGETTARIVGLDGKSTTLWWNPALDTGTCVGSMGAASGLLAITILTEIAQSGEITDADVVFDSADTWDWSTACTVFDVQSVMTHEYGHSIGIHHTDLAAGTITTRPTMFANYACDAGVASLRTLQADDQAAAQCLYPEQPTVILVDQTGSMCASTRMADTHTMANQFITDFSTNLMAVTAFAEGSTTACPPWGACAGRPGYELYQDWTPTTALLTAAVNSTFPCGLTPLWESTCCAIGKADEEGAANCLVFTDTGENSSDGTCGCTTFSDVLTYALTTNVAVYVIDITGYSSPGPVASTPGWGSEPTPPHPFDDSSDMATLASRTGGLYVHVTGSGQYLSAVRSVERHMVQMGHARQHPSDCHPGEFPIDNIQQYSGAVCAPGSPYAGSQVTITGQCTVKRGQLDPAVMYVEECSGGVQVYGTLGGTAGIGQWVTVRGVVEQSTGEVRISSLQSVQLGSPSTLPPSPIVDPGTGRICELIGSLMKVRGYVGAPVSGQRFPLISAFGTGDPEVLMVYLAPSSGINPASIHQGDNIMVTGVLRRGTSGNELAPRQPSDITLGLATGVAGGEGSPGSPGASDVTAAVSGIRSIEPMPSIREATISYELAKEGAVELRVYDVGGRLLQSLVETSLPAGRYTARWNGRGAGGERVASGVYYVRFRGPEGSSETREVLLIH